MLDNILLLKQMLMIKGSEQLPFIERCSYIADVILHTFKYETAFLFAYNDRVRAFNLIAANTTTDKYTADNLSENILSEEKCQVLTKAIKRGGISFETDGDGFDYNSLPLSASIAQHQLCFPFTSEDDHKIVLLLSSKIDFDRPLITLFLQMISDSLTKQFGMYVLEKQDKYNELYNQLLVKNKDLKELNEDLKNQKDQLQEKTRILSKVQTVAKIGHWSYKIDTEAFFISSNIYQFLGYTTKPEIPTFDLLQRHVSKSTLLKIKSTLFSVLRGKSTYDIIYQFKTLAGKTHYAHDIAELIYSEDKKSVKLFGTIQDISNINLMQNELIRQKSKYQLIFDKSPIGIYHFNKESEITECNEAYIKILHQKREQVIGFNLLKNLKDEKVIACIKATLKGKTSRYKDKYTTVISKKTLFLHMEFAPLINSNNKMLGGVCIIEDITDRKRIEERTKRSKVFRLLHAQMWEKISVFNANKEDDIYNLLFELIGVRLGPAQISYLDINAEGEAQLASSWTNPENINLDEAIYFPADLSNYFASQNYIELSYDHLNKLRETKCVLYNYRSFLMERMAANAVNKMLIIPHSVDQKFEGFIIFEWLDNINSMYNEFLYIGLDLTRLLSSTILQYRSRKMLVESEGKYRKLVENSSDGILIESKGNVLFSNQQFSDIIEYPVSEIERSSLSLFVQPSQLKELRMVIQKIKNNPLGKSSIYETNIISKNNEFIPVEINCCMINYNNQASTLMYVRDLSQRKQIETERKRLTTAMEQVHEGIVITNVNGKIEYSNSALSEITGYSANELLGKNPKIFKSGKHDKDFYYKMWTDIKSGKIWSGTIINMRKDNTLYEEHMVISPIRDYIGNLINFVAIKRDVTTEAYLERQIKQSQKLQALGTLAGGMAHDFNNILMGMQVSVEL